MKIVLKIVLLILLPLIFIQTNYGQGNDNSDRSRNIASKYKWDLTDLYSSNEQWEMKKSLLESKLSDFSEYQNQLSQSAEKLLSCLAFASEIRKEYLRLNSYASKLSDLDTRNSQALSMKQEIGQIGTKLRAATSFIEPEVLELDANTLKMFYLKKPELKLYAHYIDNIQRQKSHTLSSSEEKIIADAGIMSSTPRDIYGIFINADFPYPTVTLSDGQTVRLDAAGYGFHRYSKNRADRIKVFNAFFSAHKNYERSFGTQLYGQIKKDIFYKNTRKYKSSLESALSPDNIPSSVYMGLIAGVNKNLPSLHRYLKLRQRMLGLKDLHYYDMYPSLVNKVNINYSAEEAKIIIKEALKIFGDDYVAIVDNAFNNRWIDMYPSTGKRSGAYSSGSAYDVHPYILMNYNGNYDDMSTLAHELGHTMHSYYSNKNQPFIKSDYPAFLAEVASITNEAILIDHVLKTIKDPEKRLSILGNQLESYRTTLFRQTQFAEFELKIHQLAEEGKALTGELLSGIYLDLLKKYYGHDEGITTIEDIYGIEWAYIHHFYLNYYVFQYATSMCAATAVSEKILNEGETMRDKYINEFLSAGGSDYPIPLLKNIGIDMTTTGPLDMTINKMNKIMDEMEKILELMN